MRGGASDSLGSSGARGRVSRTPLDLVLLSKLFPLETRSSRPSLLLGSTSPLRVDARSASLRILRTSVAVPACSLRVRRVCFARRDWRCVARRVCACFLPAVQCQPFSRKSRARRAQFPGADECLRGMICTPGVSAGQHFLDLSPPAVQCQRTNR